MAIDMFLKVDGAQGESQDSNHKGWIDILSYSWGAVQTGSMASGGGGGAGRVVFNDLSVLTYADAATPAILKHSATGKHISQVTVSLCKAGGTQIEYSTVVLSDVIVTSVQFKGTTGGEQAYIGYSFQSAKVEFHYWVQQANGAKGAESQMGWDVKENRATA